MATTPINSGSSSEGVASSVNSIIRDVNNMQSIQLFKDDAGTRRVLLGKGKDGFYGLKVSQPTYDVYDATNDQLVFNSDNNLFKIVLTGTVDATVPDPFTSGSTVTTTIAHGLSVKPAFIAFVQIPTGGGTYINQGALTHVPVSLIAQTGASAGLTGVYVSGSTDTTNLSLKISNTFGANLTGLGSPWSFRYYIMQETAAAS